MSINSLHSVTKYSEELDKLFTQKSATGFFADNDLGKKFVGAKTVIIPTFEFQGLANYDRDNGFSRGAINVSNSSFTMSMDRARSLQIDREDMDETGIANLAGKILGEYVRTKVVPECDAYVISKLANVARDNNNVLPFNCDKPLEVLNSLINRVRTNVGYDEELVAFVNAGVYGLLQNSTELSKMIITSEFKQGDVNLTVKSLNGVSLIPVVSERMKCEYDFSNDTAGGFIPKENTKEVLMLVCPKKAAHLVRKTENMRVFTPEQNIDADAYKFDYRIYYDVFVKKSDAKSICSCESSNFECHINQGEKTLMLGSPIAADAYAESDTNKITFQWYIGESEDFDKAKMINGQTDNVVSYEVDKAGVYYLFLELTLDAVSKVVLDAGMYTVNE